MQVKPFFASDLKDFQFDGIERCIMTNEEAKQNISHFARIGSIFTGEQNGKVVGFGGLYPVSDDGVAVAWSLINKEAYNHIKYVIKRMRALIKSENYRRTQAMCIDHPKAKRFLECIGFTREGKLRQMLPNRDMIIYSVLRGEL